MNREIILTRLPVGRHMPLAYVRLENGRAVQMELEPPEGEERTGNIYVGKIEKLVPAMQAAFVRISPKQSGYLPLAKAKHPLVRAQRPGNELKEQDELLVQMEREAIKGKLPSLKTSLEFPGSLMVLLTDSQGIFFSPRLSAEQKERAGEWLKELRDGQEQSFGILLRTNGGNASKEELTQEFEKLYQEAFQVCRYGLTRSVYSCLRKSRPFWMELWEGLPKQEPARVITDEPEVFQTLPEAEWYQEPLQPLYKKYSLENILQNALERRVPLPSGGFLVIEQTEAFVAVDVNSGKRKGERLPDEFYYRVNEEAARETARQLRLRNLSGTILIDFINMKDKGVTDRLLRELQRRFLDDPVRTQAIDVTRLNITEATRQKVRRALWEQVMLWEQKDV